MALKLARNSTTRKLIRKLSALKLSIGCGGGGRCCIDNGFGGGICVSGLTADQCHAQGGIVVQGLCTDPTPCPSCFCCLPPPSNMTVIWNLSNPSAGCSCAPFSFCTQCGGANGPNGTFALPSAGSGTCAWYLEVPSSYSGCGGGTCTIVYDMSLRCTTAGIQLHTGVSWLFCCATDINFPCLPFHCNCNSCVKAIDVTVPDNFCRSGGGSFPVSGGTVTIIPGP